jgi:hypothetical protein
MTENSSEDQTVVSPCVITNVVQVVDGQTSDHLRRLIPQNLTTVRTATFQMPNDYSDEVSPPKIVVQSEDGGESQ